jgi:threonine 3-dehydrogenase
MPMMYMPDCLKVNFLLCEIISTSFLEKATQVLLEAPAERLSTRVYNVTAISFTPSQLARQVQQYIPHFQIEYKPDFRQYNVPLHFQQYFFFRQKIADSWPRSLDHSLAVRDWDWQPKYDLDAMVKGTFSRNKAKFLPILDCLTKLALKLKKEDPEIKLHFTPQNLE